MEKIAAWFVGTLVGLGIGLLAALIGAIPIMWLAGYLHDNGMTAVPAFGYGDSWVIALLLAWTAAFVVPSGGKS